MRIKSACVVLALSVLLILLAVGMEGYGRSARANTSIASKSQAELTTTVSREPTVVTTQSTATYIVQPGDTLSGIAARFAVPGGWPALYAANQSLLGHDPSIIQPGTVVVLPGEVAAVRYTAAPGDTLSGIAAALAVPGGWPALYAANRQAIGANPNVIQQGTVLVVPHQVPAPPRTRPGALRRLRPPSETSPAPRPARPPALTGTRHAHVPIRTQSGAVTGMPQWLTTMLLAVALLIAVAFLAEPAVVLARQRRRAAPVTAACASRNPGSAGRAAGEPRIVVADYDRLVVTHCTSDDTVYVLRPPGEDPMAVLRVARLVLPEHRYQQLADRLGASASWPVSGSRGSEPSRTRWAPPTLPDGGGGAGLQGSPQSPWRRYRSAGSDEDLLRSDSTRAAT